MYLEQIVLFGEPPGHQVTGGRRIVGYIFIPECIHGDVSLNAKVLESIGSMKLTMKGFQNEYLNQIEELKN